MEEYKLVNKYFNKSKKSSNKDALRYVNKILISFLILIVSLCLTKNKEINKFFKEKVFGNNIFFSKINELYTKMFGDVYPIKGMDSKVEEVFNETLSYESKEDYKEGVKLTVANNYLVPVLNSGLVVYSGNKDNYGYTTIIQQVNGIDVWYVGVNTNNIKLYDYVEKGSVLGEANTNTIYLYYQKDGKFIDYKEYLG